MATPRITIPKNVWAKLQTLIKQANRTDLKELLGKEKITLSPTKDAILWGPSVEFCGGLMDLLARERTFVRRTSANGPIYDGVIATLKTVAKREPVFQNGYNGVSSAPS